MPLSTRLTKPTAHSTHTLWQIGKSIQCKGCGLSGHLDDQDRLILTKGLQKECKGHKPNSPTLAQFFSQASQTTRGSQRTMPHNEAPSASTTVPQETTGHETQPACQSPGTATDAHAFLSPPAPKKPRFSTGHERTSEQDDGSHEGGEEEQPTEYDPIQVDYC